MPDQADIEQALASFGAEALRDDPAEVRVYRGWPRAASLEADLQAGLAHLSVTPTGASRDATRYPVEWQGRVPARTLTAVADGEAVTFGGTARPGQVAGLRVDGVAYAYRLRDGDTPGAVAAELAGMVRLDRPAELHGTAVTMPGGRDVLARVVADGAGGTELRRQRQPMRMTLWCPTPDVRDRLASMLDVAVAGAPVLDVGGWACRVQGAGGATTDDGAAAGIWRRDLVYLVEYPTVGGGGFAGDAVGDCFGGGPGGGRVMGRFGSVVWSRRCSQDPPHPDPAAEEKDESVLPASDAGGSVFRLIWI